MNTNISEKSHCRNLMARYYAFILQGECQRPFCPGFPGLLPCEYSKNDFTTFSFASKATKLRMISKFLDLVQSSDRQEDLKV